VSRLKQGAPRTIRRYSNRKLYDPAERRYVTLQELARLVARGEEVSVLDQQTGEDLTSLTLAQVLLENVREGASRIPREALKQLIRITEAPAATAREWPAPEHAAARARRETEQLVSRMLGPGRLSLDDAVALRHGLSEIVQRLVREAQAGVESRLRGLLARGEAAAERSFGALRERIEGYVAPAREQPAKAGRTAVRTAQAGRARAKTASRKRRRSRRAKPRTEG
jgi:polyhydroxyalkanoate synthesis repressor PhaR